MTALLQSLEVHNAAFERLLALIPAKHYIRTETDQDQVRRRRRPPLSVCSSAAWVPPDVPVPSYLLFASTATST